MPDANRIEIVRRADPVVVKVGTNVLADGLVPWTDGGSRRWPNSSAGRGPAAARSPWSAPGRSGPASAGSASAGGRPTCRTSRRAPRSASAPHAGLPGRPGPHGVHAAQILLTAGDFDSRARYLNVRNTILTLFEYGCLPIINENDTVSVAEIKFGDNDHLAAMVTNLLQAPLLVLLTNVDGLFTADPRTDPAAQLVATVPHIDRAITDMAAADAERPRHRRHAEQAAGGPAGDGGRRVGHHGERLDDGMLDAVFAGERSARCSCRTARRCRPAGGGSG